MENSNDSSYKIYETGEGKGDDETKRKMTYREAPRKNYYGKKPQTDDDKKINFFGNGNEKILLTPIGKHVELPNIYYTLPVTNDNDNNNYFNRNKNVLLNYDSKKIGKVERPGTSGKNKATEVMKNLTGNDTFVNIQKNAKKNGSDSTVSFQTTNNKNNSNSMRLNYAPNKIGNGNYTKHTTFSQKLKPKPQTISSPFPWASKRPTIFVPYEVEEIIEENVGVNVDDESTTTTTTKHKLESIKNQYLQEGDKLNIATTPYSQNSLDFLKESIKTIINGLINSNGSDRTGRQNDDDSTTTRFKSKSFDFLDGPEIENFSQSRDNLQNSVFTKILNFETTVTTTEPEITVDSTTEYTSAKSNLNDELSKRISSTEFDVERENRTEPLNLKTGVMTESTTLSSFLTPRSNRGKINTQVFLTEPSTKSTTKNYNTEPQPRSFFTRGFKFNDLKESSGERDVRPSTTEEHVFFSNIPNDIVFETESDATHSTSNPSTMTTTTPSPSFQTETTNASPSTFQLTNGITETTPFHSTEEQNTGSTKWIKELTDSPLLFNLLTTVRETESNTKYEIETPNPDDKSKDQRRSDILILETLENDPTSTTERENSNYLESLRGKTLNANVSIDSVVSTVPLIIDDLRNGKMNAQDSKILSQIFRDYWPQLLTLSKDVNVDMLPLMKLKNEEDFKNALKNYYSTETTSVATETTEKQNVATETTEKQNVADNNLIHFLFYDYMDDYKNTFYDETDEDYDEEEQTSSVRPKRKIIKGKFYDGATPTEKQNFKIQPAEENFDVVEQKIIQNDKHDKSE
mgnify:FL=1